MARGWGEEGCSLALSALWDEEGSQVPRPWPQPPAHPHPCSPHTQTPGLALGSGCSLQKASGLFPALWGLCLCQDIALGLLPEREACISPVSLERDSNAADTAVLSGWVTSGLRSAVAKLLAIS